MKLNRIASAIDRIGRNDINENFDILERGYGKAAMDAQSAKSISEQAKQIADSIDGKATQALQNSNDALETSDEAKVLAESVQTQFNQVVIQGDSSVEAAQARVSADATVYDTLKARLDAENEQLTQQLAHKTAITPEDFEGNALEKLQQALDYAINNDIALELKHLYDITGLGTILVNKTQNYSPNTNRKNVYINGLGGGIKKTDEGCMFSSNEVDVGDIHLKNVKFESVEGAGTCVFDGDKLINIFAVECFSLNVDGFARNLLSTRYAQGWNFVRCKIIGGNGWAIEFDNAWALNLDSNIIEWREHGIRNCGEVHQINNLVNIIGNTIEGMRGKSVELNGCNSLNFSGNYLEYNLGGYVEFKSTNNSAVLKNNFIVLYPDQNNADGVAIKLSGGVYRSEGNVTNGIMFDNNAGATVYSTADRQGTNKPFSTGNTTYVYRQKTDISSVSASASGSGVIKTYGQITTLTSKKTETLLADETKAVDITFDDAIKDEDLIGVQVQGLGYDLGAQKINQYKLNSNTVRVTVKNNYSDAMVFVLTVTVLKNGNLSYYG